MFETRIDEVDLGEHTRSGGQSSLLSTERRLVRALRGRVCFDFGVSARCFETTVTLAEGETRKLGATVGVRGMQLALETAFKMDRTLTYGIGNCDSIAPVLCYEDATVEVYERTGKLLFMDLAANEVIFSPGPQRPFVAGNKILDDPDCGCASATRASGGDDDRVSVELDHFLTRLFTVRELTPNRADEVRPDRAEMTTAALSVVESWLTPTQPDVPEAVGLVDIHGHVSWFSGALKPTRLRDVVLVSHDCNASTRGYLAVPENDERYPVLIVSTAEYAVTGSLRLFLMEGGHMVQYDDDLLEVRAGRMSTGFTMLDFSAFPHGAHGEMHLQLFNSAGDAVTEPLVEPFKVVTQPTLADEPQPA